MTQLETIASFLDRHHHDRAEELREFVDAVIRPRSEPEDDDDARVQARELLDLMGQAELYAPIRDRDLRGMCLAREAIAAASPLADNVYALQGLATTPLLLADNPAMRETWAEPALRGAAMGAFAMTEPDAGSDVASLKTTAVRDGGDYVINGEKHYISNAGIADFYAVMARTGSEEEGARGVSCFVVGAATPGVVFAGPQILSAPHPLGAVRFEDCRVPAACRLGEEGAGFGLGMRVLDRLRPTVAAAACGMAHRALEEALAHATTRHQFGRPLADFQLVQQKLARTATELDAARLLTYRAAAAADSGQERITREAAMAKLFASEMAQRAIDDAVQVLGGAGVLAASVTDRLYRAVRALRIYEGTSEIQHLVIAGQLLRDRRTRSEQEGE
jgi:acyl-CoA dehydrogenase